MHYYMKRILLAGLVVFFGFFAQAQDPVKWTFSAKKIDDKTYEVHLTAAVQSPWKIYSQSTPEGGPVPTGFTFTKNPLVTLEGKVKEVGEMHKKHEEVFGVDVYYYKDKVDFVQVVKLKSKAKTNLNGKLEFMACDEVQCLPPKEVVFSVALK